MPEIPGMIKPDLQALPQIKERMTFLYLERCVLNRADGAITVTDARGVVHVPAASLSVLMLGPGTNVSHRAMELLGDAGVTMLWVGEHGVRYYAAGRPMTHSARLLIRQAALVSNVRTRISAARRMYQLRFGSEDVSALTMQQLRGREGARVRSVYRQCAKETGIAWEGREYDPDDFQASSPINQALTAGHACLYGLAHSVILSLGCSAGLGIVHTGHERSFVYDIADLYKATTSIPLAFQVAAANPSDIGAVMRRAMREAFRSGHLLEQMVKDIHLVLDDSISDEEEAVTLHLWDEKSGSVSSGYNYDNPLRDNMNDEAEAKEAGYGNLVKGAE